MRLFEPLVSFFSDSEWCGRFREELEIDRSFWGWVRAFRAAAAGLAGRMVLVGLIVVFVIFYVLRTPN
jgi:hypothetical protein